MTRAPSRSRSASHGRADRTPWRPHASAAAPVRPAPHDDVGTKGLKKGTMASAKLIEDTKVGVQGKVARMGCTKLGDVDTYITVMPTGPIGHANGKNAGWFRAAARIIQSISNSRKTARAEPIGRCADTLAPYACVGHVASSQAAPGLCDRSVPVLPDESAVHLALLGDASLDALRNLAREPGRLMSQGATPTVALGCLYVNRLPS